MKIKLIGNVIVIKTEIDYESLLKYFPEGVLVEHPETGKPLYKMQASPITQFTQYGCTVRAQQADGNAIMVYALDTDEKPDKNDFVQANADAIAALQEFEPIISEIIAERVCSINNIIAEIEEE